MLIKESVLRNIIRQTLIKNNFQINELFYDELNDKIINEGFMQKIKEKLGIGGLAAFTFINSLISTGEASAKQLNPEALEESIADEAIKKIMNEKGVGYEEAREIWSNEALESGEEQHLKGKKMFDTFQGKIRGDAKDRRVAFKSTINSLRDAYNKSQKEAHERSKKLGKNPYLRLKGLKKVDSKNSDQVMANYNYENIITNFLLQISTEYELNYDINQLQKGTKNANVAKKLKSSGIIKNSEELVEFLETGNLPMSK